MSDKRLTKQLFEVIASIETAKEAEAFFKDLCTMQEIEYMSQRVESAKLLMENKTYQEVFRSVNISSATLSRVSKCVKYNTGYNKVLSRFFTSEEEK